MSLKKITRKSISLALASIIFISPILDTVFAMENELNSGIIQNEIVDMISEEYADIIWDEDSEIGEVCYVYKENNEKQSRTLWDFLDIGMPGLSWYDVLKEPSFKNIGWAILDTAAIAPLIPSSAYIRKCGKLTVSTSSLKKLASSTKGKNAIKKSLKVTKVNSELLRISKLAKNYKLTEFRYKKHILAFHGANSTKKNKSKFISAFDIKKGIRDTLTNDSIIKNNTKCREGYIFTKTYKGTIGHDTKGRKLNTIKVVLNKDGTVNTAYPIK